MPSGILGTSNAQVSVHEPCKKHLRREGGVGGHLLGQMVSQDLMVVERRSWLFLTTLALAPVLLCLIFGSLYGGILDRH